jgi:hypothetical protein
MQVARIGRGDQFAAWEEGRREEETLRAPVDLQVDEVC